MAVQTETIDSVFDQAFAGFRKATESIIHFQQDMFRQWTQFYPTFPKPPGAVTEPIQKCQKEWAKTLTEMTRKFQETWDSQYKAGLRLITEAFKVAETRDPEELRQKTVELWNKAFACLQGLAQTQVKEFQAASAKWIEMMSKPNA
jgi:hypothetical protein